MGDRAATTGTRTGDDAPGKDAGLSLTDAYLLLYNTACAVGWNLTMYKIGTALLEGGGVRDAIEATHDIVVALQLLSTLEFVHACVGLVRGERAGGAKSSSGRARAHEPTTKRMKHVLVCRVIKVDRVRDNGSMKHFAVACSPSTLQGPAATTQQYRRCRVCNPKTPAELDRSCEQVDTCK